MQPISSALRRPGITAFMIVALAILGTPPRRATAQDTIDGAVWRFEMTNKTNPGRKFNGRYRVSDHVLYQKDSPEDAEYAKRVGTNHPNGKRTQFEVEDFRVLIPGQKAQLRIKGTARLVMVKFGEWEGVFIDGRGVNWDFKAFRIIE